MLPAPGARRDGGGAERQFGALVEQETNDMYRSEMASSDDLEGEFHTVEDGPFVGW